MCFSGALDQAKVRGDRYSRGVLGGTEFAMYRFIVVVSEIEVDMPDDVIISGIDCRYPSIVTAPKTPSKIPT